MSRLSSAHRRRPPSRRLPLDELREIMGTQDASGMCYLAKVTAPDNAPRYYVDQGRVFVEVVTVPDGLDLTARLGTIGSGQSTGDWWIPKEGAMVIVAVPSGAIEFMPTIVAVLDSGAAPDGVSDDKVLRVSEVKQHWRAPEFHIGPNADMVEIVQAHTHVKNNEVKLGPNPAIQTSQINGHVLGGGIDPYTGVSYWVLGAASQKVTSAK